MASHPAPLLRRALSAALAALAILVVLPGVAAAHPKAVVRLLANDPALGSTSFTMPDGTPFTSKPGLLRLRLTPAGESPREKRAFCVDALHPFPLNKDFDVYLSDSRYDARLDTPRYAEAGWLLQNAERLIAAAPSNLRTLEAGALQTAVWQLTDQAREVNPSSNAALNARTAELRTLAAGRTLGGPVTISAAAPRGCAGRGAVSIALTGRPGSTATLAVTSGAGTVSPAEVRFGADGTATAAVSAATHGTVQVTARSEGGTLTRIARTNPGAVRPQETLILNPQSHTATTSVIFEDCPVIPFEEGPGPSTTPTTTPPSTGGPTTPLETPVAKPVVPGAPPSGSGPRRPAQAGPRFTLVKSGPARVMAGRRARYTITLTNTGTTTLRGLTIADELPAGMSLTRVPSGSRLRGGDLAWSLAPLAPGARRRVNVDIRFDADISGRRCNRARATASGLTPRAAKACTRVIADPRAITPAVTA